MFSLSASCTATNLGHSILHFQGCRTPNIPNLTTQPTTSYDDNRHIMVPNQAPPPTAKITNSLPALVRATTLPPYINQRNVGDRSLLTPEDAIYHGSPPRRHSAAVNKLQKDLRMTNGTNGDTGVSRLRRGRHKERNGSEVSRRKGTWKKLLWVKQSCE